MKNILLCLSFCLLGFFALAQTGTGLNGIIVEKYYIADQNDRDASLAAESDAGISNPVGVPVGAVTYRIYVDMKVGYKFSAVFGNSTNNLKLTTTTSFYNHPDGVSVSAPATFTNTKANTVALDSYLAVGGPATNKLAVLKSEDNNTLGGANWVTTVLKNTDPAMGLPLTTNDGFWNGNPETFKNVGFSPEQENVFKLANQNSLLITSGSWYCENGAVGPIATSNKILIAQVTTDGKLSYELNVQIATPTVGVSEKYVHTTPAAGEFTHPTLKGSIGGTNTPPTVTLAGATSALTGEVKTFTATAADADGTIANVVFKVDGTTVSTDATSPYSFDYTSVLGTHTITAVATDDQGGVTTSAPLILVVTAVPVDPAPVVSITAPVAAASSKVLTPVAIAATATDNGSVTKVEFFVDGIALSTDLTAPYAAIYTPTSTGAHSITAKATDNIGQTTTAAVSITVVANVAPTVSITAPANGSTVNVNTSVVLSATAGDTDGTVASVEFKVNGVSVAVVNTAPYTTTWTAPATEQDGVVIEATATDNDGAITKATVTVNVMDPALEKPYVIGNVSKPCYDTYVVRMPVSSTKTTMAGVIGYDIALNYDGRKVVPNGKIVLHKDLIDSTKVSYLTNIVANADESKNVLNITIFLNGSAAGTDNFKGKGKLFSAEFIKRPTFQSVDEVVFKIDTVFESYPTKIEKRMAKEGKFITFKENQFEGNLKYWKDESAIKYDKANPTNYLVTNITGNLDVPQANSVQPDLAGKFTYNVVNGPKIGIDRDILFSTDVHNVIMSSDALATAYIANKNGLILTPTVFSMIAADVNLDGKVTAGDASQINLRAVNKITQFEQVWNASGKPDFGKNSKDWLFISYSKIAADSKFNISATYPNDDNKGFSSNKVPFVDFNQSLPNVDPDCPHYGSDVFYGVMLGDVNGDFATKAALGDGLKSAQINEDFVTLDFSKAVVENNVVTVPVSVSTSLNELHAIDLGIFINSKKIENIEVVPIPNDNFSSLNFGYNADTKKLDIAGFSFNSIPTNNAFSLKITKKNSSDVLVASDFDGVQVDLTNNPMGKIINGTLQVIDQTTGISPDQFSSVSVYPNPAKDHIYVNVSEDSKVRIFDINGRLVIDTTVNGGQKLINVQNLTNGVYMLKVYNNANREQSIHKVIIQN
jgi:hypothetical protein